MTIKSLLPEEIVIELPENYENDEEKPFLLATLLNYVLNVKTKLNYLRNQ